MVWEKFFCVRCRKLERKISFVAKEIVQDVTTSPKLHLVLCWLKGKDLEIPIEGICQSTYRRYSFGFF